MRKATAFLVIIPMLALAQLPEPGGSSGGGGGGGGATVATTAECKTGTDTSEACAPAGVSAAILAETNSGVTRDSATAFTVTGAKWGAGDQVTNQTTDYSFIKLTFAISAVSGTSTVTLTLSNSVGDADYWLDAGMTLNISGVTGGTNCTNLNGLRTIASITNATTVVLGGGFTLPGSCTGASALGTLGAAIGGQSGTALVANTEAGLTKVYVEGATGTIYCRSANGTSCDETAASVDIVQVADIDDVHDVDERATLSISAGDIGSTVTHVRTANGDKKNYSFGADFSLTNNGNGSTVDLASTVCKSSGTNCLVTSLSGSTAKAATTTGTLTSGRCVEIDASGNFIQHSAACNSSSYDPFSTTMLGPITEDFLIGPIVSTTGAVGSNAFQVAAGAGTPTTTATDVAEVNHAGVISITTATADNNDVSIGYNGVGLRAFYPMATLVGAKIMCIFKTGASVSGVNLFCGLAYTGQFSANRLGIEFDTDQSDTNFVCLSGDSDTTSTRNSIGVAPATATWYVATVELVAASQARCTVNGTSVTPTAFSAGDVSALGLLPMVGVRNRDASAKTILVDKMVVGGTMSGR